MSIETWKAQYYPVDAWTVTATEAIAHSLRKWKGLTPEALEEHGLYISSHFLCDKTTRERVFMLSATSCALCVQHPDSCDECPLSLVRNGVPCDQRTDGEVLPPYSSMTKCADPTPMVIWLQKALNKQQGTSE